MRIVQTESAGTEVVATTASLTRATTTIDENEEKRGVGTGGGRGNNCCYTFCYSLYFYYTFQLILRESFSNSCRHMGWQSFHQATNDAYNNMT